MILIGIIIGLIISVLIFSILAFFRAGIEKRVRIIETVIGSAGPREKGAIFIPENDAEIFRQELIKKNKKEGKDTRLSELE